MPLNPKVLSKPWAALKFLKVLTLTRKRGPVYEVKLGLDNLGAVKFIAGCVHAQQIETNIKTQSFLMICCVMYGDDMVLLCNIKLYSFMVYNYSQPIVLKWDKESKRE